jgi:hypothetical protein
MDSELIPATVVRPAKISGTKSKKAPRPGAFLLPKPKPMRRITLLLSIRTPQRDFGYRFVKKIMVLL